MWRAGRVGWAKEMRGGGEGKGLGIRGARGVGRQSERREEEELKTKRAGGGEEWRARRVGGWRSRCEALRNRV